MSATKTTNSAQGPTIVWFRSDLRVADNAALLAASQNGHETICLYVLDDAADESTRYGEAQRWWLHHSLIALSNSLRDLGAQLVLRRGDPGSVIKQIIAETSARSVFWNRRYATSHIDRDSALKSALKQSGLDVRTYDGALLHEPTLLKTGSGGPYRVYSPFWRAFSAGPEPRDPAPAPVSIKAFSGSLQSDDIENWQLLPTNPNWATGIAEEWTPGEAGARQRLDEFLDGPIENYGEGRDIPGKNSTSKLSPHLTFGEISPFQVWAATNTRQPDHTKDKEKFRKEIVWREFSYHLLVNFKDLRNKNFNTTFDGFPWRENADHLHAWQMGKTGYPIVDAGMRQLWQTGWMHNRVRMVVGSFLVKHLLIDWRQGESWFWDTLVDADPAANTASWQWIAGSGADAAPYFRVFNPIIQGQKFDSDGAYVKAFCPELADLPQKYLHKPWEAPAPVLADAGIRLGETYPLPIVDHTTARNRALAAYQTMREEAA